MIGFLDESLPGRRMTASPIAAFNNRREAQWGVSPRDRQAVLAAFLVRPILMIEAGRSWAAKAERVILEAEDQVSPVVDKANAGLDSFEEES